MYCDGKLYDNANNKDWDIYLFIYLATMCANVSNGRRLTRNLHHDEKQFLKDLWELKLFLATCMNRAICLITALSFGSNNNSWIFSLYNYAHHHSEHIFYRFYAPCFLWQTSEWDGKMVCERSLSFCFMPSYESIVNVSSFYFSKWFIKSRSTILLESWMSA